jgi:hypothetical protein
MRESGCINHEEAVMVAEAKANTVTSNLLQLTVLAFVRILKFCLTPNSICGPVVPKSIRMYLPVLVVQ